MLPEAEAVRCSTRSASCARRRFWSTGRAATRTRAARVLGGTVVLKVQSTDCSTRRTWAGCADVRPTTRRQRVRHASSPGFGMHLSRWPRSMVCSFKNGSTRVSSCSSVCKARAAVSAPSSPWAWAAPQWSSTAISPSPSRRSTPDQPLAQPRITPWMAAAAGFPRKRAGRRRRGGPRLTRNLGAWRPPWGRPGRPPGEPAHRARLRAGADRLRVPPAERSAVKRARHRRRRGRRQALRSPRRARRYAADRGGGSRSPAAGCWPGTSTARSTAPRRPLALGAAQGFTVWAIDRPGYGASAGVPDDRIDILGQAGTRAPERSTPSRASTTSAPASSWSATPPG